MALHKTVSELLETMSYQEYVLWLEFFGKRPYGWREDVRTYNIMVSSGNVKQSIDKIFASAKTMKEASAERSTSQKLAGSFLHHKLLSAKGGDKLSLLGEM